MDVEDAHFGRHGMCLLFFFFFVCCSVSLFVFFEDEVVDRKGQAAGHTI